MGLAENVVRTVGSVAGNKVVREQAADTVTENPEKTASTVSTGVSVVSSFFGPGAGPAAAVGEESAETTVDKTMLRRKKGQDAMIDRSDNDGGGGLPVNPVVLLGAAAIAAFVFLRGN